MSETSFYLLQTPGSVPFDNLSDVGGFLPDALCRLASGAGFRTRALHTNRDEAVFSVQRPILLNGIPTLTEQADVGRRSIVINLATIPSGTAAG